MGTGNGQEETVPVTLDYDGTLTNDIIKNRGCRCAETGEKAM